MIPSNPSPSYIENTRERSGLATPYRSSLAAHYGDVRKRLRGAIQRTPPEDIVVLPQRAPVERWPRYAPVAPFDHYVPHPPTAMAWKLIVGDVARKHGLTLKDLVGTKRTRPFIIARQEAYWRLRQETEMSLPQIGRLFGGKDHTGVLHGVRMHARRLAAAQ